VGHSELTHRYLPCRLRDLSAIKDEDLTEGRRLFLPSAPERYGEAFWRAHHEAERQSALNQREYREAHGIPLKAFGNWRAKFKAEPQPPVRKLLYRRRA
jgi:hypothetical protein